ARGRGEPAGDVRPVGQRVPDAVGLARAVALDIALGTPAVGQVGPGGAVGDRQVVGQREVHLGGDRADRLGPRLYVRDVLRADAVDLQVVHAPGRVLLGERVDVLLGTGLGVVDVVHVLAVVVLLGLAGVRDVLGVEAGPRDRGVLQDRVGRDAGRDVETELQAQGVGRGQDAGHDPAGSKRQRGERYRQFLQPWTHRPSS